MNRIALYILVLIPAVAANTWAQNARLPQRGSRGAVERPTSLTPLPMQLAEPYRQLLEISIFARDRRPDGVAVEPPVVPQRPNPENYLTFRGVADDGERILAFIEDTRDGSQIRVRVDDPLANGKILDIAPAGLVYQRKETAEKFTIVLGSNLAGTEMTPPDSTGAGFSRPTSDGFAPRGSALSPDGGIAPRGTRGSGRQRNGGPQNGRRRGGANSGTFAG
jgi:hypothetical protein